MTIEDRTLTQGDRFVGTYKKERFTVAYDEPDNKRPFGLVGATDKNVALGARYLSLSDAGKTIMGGIACNGWRFFTRESEAPAPAAEAEAPAKPKASRAKKPKQIAEEPKKRTTKIVDGGMRQVYTDEQPEAAKDNDDPEPEA